jgi:radical SAM superfamily enzyme YgiQ (UPF0313 family)
MKICNVSDPLSFQLQKAHPLGSRARVLLTSVFGPFARDDEYGSRADNLMELHHNQVTRVQGPFSLRMFHRSSGLKLIQANIAAQCTLLDYPDLDRFVLELRTHRYDIIGISAIQPNVRKVEKMCSLIREHQPEAAIVVGGHISNMCDPDKRFDADILVRGEGVRWFRRFVGEDPNKPINHPYIPSGINRRCMGLDLDRFGRDSTAVILPSVGCPVGCNFCSTSAMFGGKGKHVNFYETGDELFDIMSQLEEQMGVWSFFVMDENFLLHRKRALRLLELMEERGKAWSMHVFSSANALKSFTMEQLVDMGVSWVWIGLEGEKSQYGKLQGADTHSLVRELQENGIRVLGSTIIGLEEHSPANIDAVIDWAVSHNTEFHQFMLYTPPQGTPLHQELSEKGLLIDESELDLADVHGQYRFNYRHPHIPSGQEAEFLLRAFQRDFEVNGPSVIRIMPTLMKGWNKYKNHPSPRIRRRFQKELEAMPVLYAGALWAARAWLGGDSPVTPQITRTLEQIRQEFGFRSRISAPILGRIILHRIRKEEKRLAGGHTYEPPTFYETSVRIFKPRVTS